ncbi:hypothetical protein BRADI_4g05062v3 [Brachypodium distachyon]|uniref:Uncharacterized protein n=1 Tax=Brachypodium distachyon TaxID=15368 RepID=A0A0Q3IJI2_BRADI|nr:hypothetical protein BRADI_4g05062v3 [Brachypodium distachyon]
MEYLLVVSVLCPLKDATHLGGRIGVSSIYMLRAFRRETQIWISLLNKVSTPLSRSHANCFFWNILKIRGHLVQAGFTICLNRSEDDSSTDTEASLSSVYSMTTLQLCWSAESHVLIIFLNCCCALLVRRMEDCILARIALSSPLLRTNCIS